MLFFREKLVGFVVGVKGSKVFCLQSDSMKTVDVPQSASMHKCVDDCGVASCVMCDIGARRLFLRRFECLTHRHCVTFYHRQCVTFVQVHTAWRRRQRTRDCPAWFVHFPALFPPFSRARIECRVFYGSACCYNN